LIDQLQRQNEQQQKLQRLKLQLEESKERLS